MHVQCNMSFAYLHTCNSSTANKVLKKLLSQYSTVPYSAVQTFKICYTILVHVQTCQLIRFCCGYYNKGDYKISRYLKLMSHSPNFHNKLYFVTMAYVFLAL